ncbi:MAG: FAD-dependent 5-carboxymethylaminomethyl-2-thiouridine(34) oxidoreductase MnmC [Burkholderiaceae bacterium]
MLDGASAPATGASGNPAGLFHGVVHAHDGAHAQLLRAAALRAEQAYRPLLARQALPGAVAGLLRGAWSDDPAALQSLAQAQALPPDYAQVLDGEAASALAGCALPGAAWHFPGGGWLQPPALAAHCLRESGARLQRGVPVVSLERHGDRWRAIGPGGEVLAEADVAVVAAAQASAALLSPHADAGHWPWRRNRGQVTLLDATAAAGLPRPALPVASGGYLIALPAEMGGPLGGGMVCGATSHEGDDEPAVRAADHGANLVQLMSLLGLDPAQADQVMRRPGVSGRVGWRVGLDDRLPVVGPVPARGEALQGAHRLEQPRQVPRVAGLYVLAGLGSRGITWAPLLADTLAAWVTGAPSPLPSSLLDAVDPARFVSRGVRQPARR